MIQIVLMDDRQYILRYESFDNNEEPSILAYVRKAIREDEVIRIAVRKWPCKKTKEEK